MSLKYFSVHNRHESAGSLEGLAGDAVLVKEGFSWPAFFFTMFWLAYKRMWIVLAIAAAVQVLIVVAGEAGWLPEVMVTVLNLFFGLFLGFEGNNLYRWTLARQRYRETGYVVAPSMELAEVRYFAHQAAADQPA